MMGVQIASPNRAKKLYVESTVARLLDCASALMR